MDQSRPANWDREIEEQLWLEELGTALIPFIAVADRIPPAPGATDLDDPWPPGCKWLTKEQWFLLRKFATGVAYNPEDK